MGREAWEGIWFPKSFGGTHYSTSYQEAEVVISGPEKKCERASSVTQKERLCPLPNCQGLLYDAVIRGKKKRPFVFSLKDEKI